jgi:hypothetical protein
MKIELDVWLIVYAGWVRGGERNGNLLKRWRVLYRLRQLEVKGMSR